MGKRAKTLIIVSASVLLLGGAAAIVGPPLYRDYFAAPAAEVPTLSADDSVLSETSTGPLDPALFRGSWVIGEGSYAGYRVNEVLNSTPVTVTGRTGEVTGTLELDGLTLSKADIAVDVASIKTDQPQRDSYFRDQLIKASKYPDATFSLTAPVTASKTPTSGEVVEQTVSGDLTIAGATKQVTFTVQLQAFADQQGSAPGTVEVGGQIPITFADFGLTAPNLGFVSVEPTGFVEFSLVIEGPTS